MTVGSGLPKARHMRVTLLPSFTVMSEEMLTICGGTARHNKEQSCRHTSGSAGERCCLNSLPAILPVSLYGD